MLWLSDDRPKASRPTTPSIRLRPSRNSELRWQHTSGSTTMLRASRIASSQRVATAWAIDTISNLDAVPGRAWASRPRSGPMTSAIFG
jgi:hypothetical protein